MIYINLIAIFIFIGSIGMLYYYKKAAKTKKSVFILFWLLAAGGIIARFLFANVYSGHSTDLTCFLGWSGMVYDNGFSNFYHIDAFTDYPPGYMYILYLVEAIRRVLGIAYSSAGHILLIKMPAILSDFGIALLIYHAGKKHISKTMGLFGLTMYLWNPAVFLNSVIWGQVDAVFTLFVVLSCYFVAEKKLPFAYFSFAMGIFIKPQTLIFTPVLLYGLFNEYILPYIKQRDRLIKEVAKQVILGIAAIGTIILFMLPFGLSSAIKQYITTMASYPYASINAYNFWTMLGKNWSSQQETFMGISYASWGTIFILLFVAASAWIYMQWRKRKEWSYFVAAFIVMSMFLFSVRMHERYLYPVIALLLLAFAVSQKKEIFYAYIGFSIAQFYNVAYVLFFYKPDQFNPKEVIPILISIGTVIFYFVVLYRNLFSKESKVLVSEMRNKTKVRQIKKEFLIEKSEIPYSITKTDILAILIITFIYALIAFYDLGDKKAPKTQWESNQNGDMIILDMGEPVEFSKISYFLGNYESRDFLTGTSYSFDGPWENKQDIVMNSVFAWGSFDVQSTGQYFMFTSKEDKSVIRELAIIDKAGNKRIPVNVNDYPELFDEQELYPERSTFRDSTYFDEIYHARTAYEYLKGIRSYENTHPPLGKIFISLGMLMFGVNPFGWRFAGTVFGIFMIPIIYLFAKRFFKTSWISIIITLLFTFDFMHFSQSRIATIDVFVTFFILLMYYFMYRYSTMSFYDTSLKKTFIPLGLCGISMGLAMASKWTGIYGAVGLAIIFFWTLGKRYIEYRYARKNPRGKTNGFSHDMIISSFPKNSKKTIGFCMIFFVVIPALIYLFSYLPFVNTPGMGLIERAVKNQIDMFSYHSNLVSTHPYSSRWYQWPIMYRPIWYYSGNISKEVAEGISAFGNPLVWWAGIPAFCYMVYLTFRKKDKKALFLCIAYLAEYVPWMFVTRTTYIYHYFTSVPFIVMMVGYSIYNIVEKWPKLKIGAWAYCVVGIGMFVLFYPVLSGQPVNREFVYQWLRWFDSWVLVG